MKLKNALPVLLLLAGTTVGIVAIEPLACNMNALTRAERERHRVLLGKLGAAVTDRRELPNGYALTIDRDKMPVTELAEWVALEARCCPFLDFAIEVRGKGGPATLRLTGGEGVKAFIAAELMVMAAS